MPRQHCRNCGSPSTVSRRRHRDSRRLTMVFRFARAPRGDTLHSAGAQFAHGNPDRKRPFLNMQMRTSRLFAVTSLIAALSANAVRAQASNSDARWVGSAVGFSLGVSRFNGDYLGSTGLVVNAHVIQERTAGVGVGVGLTHAIGLLASVCPVSSGSTCGGGSEHITYLLAGPRIFSPVGTGRVTMALSAGLALWEGDVHPSFSADIGAYVPTRGNRIFVSELRGRVDSFVRRTEGSRNRSVELALGLLWRL
jgi:hypothetical protein